MPLRLVFPALLSVLLLPGCSKPSQSKDAVQTAIVEHLKKRDDMMATSMKVVVDSVNFRDKEADVIVTISPKEGGSGIQMTYNLVAEGSGWAVKKSSAQSGGSPHSPADPGGSLPSGHPPVGAPGSQMPPNHPPVPTPGQK
jgi:hypothetical protein